MKTRTLLTALFSAILLPVMVQSASAQTMPEEMEPIKAPFDMPQLQRPSFPARTLYLNKVGAKPGKLCTKQIQAAIDRLTQQGGGTLVVPKGQWLTGRITLKSNVCLHLAEGAELHFSGDVADYMPAVACRNEGVDIYGPGAMIYADGAENIAVTGKGKLVAPSRDCQLLRLTMSGIPESVQDMPLQERVFDGLHRYDDIRFANHDVDSVLRVNRTATASMPKKALEPSFFISQAASKSQSLAQGVICLPVFFGPMNSRNVLLEGVTFEGSIFWNIVPVYCENIIIRGVTVSSAGIARTDGIDIDSSRNALIEYTTLDCGDDCFTLKAGRGMDGVLKARPTENVVIRHCTAKRGAGGLTIGSETAAGIRNVYMYDVTIENPSYGIYFKTRRPRGGGGENLWFEQLHMKNPKRRAIYWDMLGSATYVGKLAERFNKDNNPRLTPYFRNIHFKDVTIDACDDFIRAIGLPESPVEDVTFQNVVSHGSQQIRLQDVGKFEIMQ